MSVLWFDNHPNCRDGGVEPAYHYHILQSPFDLMGLGLPWRM